MNALNRVMLVSGLALGVGLLASGCRSKETPTQAAEPAPRPGEAQPLASVSFQDAEVREVAAFLRAFLNKPVEVEPGLEEAGRCFALDVYEPRPISARQTLQLINDRYARLGLTLIEADDRLVLRRLPGVEIPERCRGTSPGAAPAPSAPAPQDTAAAQVLRGIRQISPAEIEITEASFKLAEQNSEQLFGPVRLVAPGPTGEEGVRLFGVRTGSVAAALGLQNGDRLLSAGATRLTSKEQAKDLAQTLKAKRLVKVRLQRGGQEIEVTYRLVPG